MSSYEYEHAWHNEESFCQCPPPPTHFSRMPCCTHHLLHTPCLLRRTRTAADCPGDGLLGSSDERSYDFCCDSGCGECCGTGCSSRTGGGSKCCCSDIEESAYFCDGDAEPPCIVVPEVRRIQNLTLRGKPLIHRILPPQPHLSSNGRVLFVPTR